MKCFAVIFFAMVLFATGVEAASMTVSHPRPMAGNPHIKLLTYKPHGMHYYKGFFGFESSLIFGDFEEFELIAMGDPKGWQVNPLENRLFLKPLDSGANTNATIITRDKATKERRVYLFRLYAGEAKNMEDEELAYEVRIVHAGFKTSADGSFVPDSVGAAPEAEDAPKSLPGGVPDAGNPNLNYDYTIAGDKEIRPIRAFDDGRFTYVQFPKDVQLPAVFIVDPDGYEGIINFRVYGDYIVIEATGSLFSMRRDSSSACLFNEQKPYVGKHIKKHSRGVFVKSN